jgi:hypothetical protein
MVSLFRARPYGQLIRPRLYFMKVQLVIRQRGNIMQKTFKYETIEKILAEADERLQQIDTAIIEYMEQEKRIQIEQQAQGLERLKSEVQDKIGKEGALESRPYGEGMHEEIEDIAKAMKAMASYLR